jgi:predicted AAA+ superfamily ATPase
VDFRIRIYAGGDDARSAVHNLVEQKTEWLARLNGIENLPDSMAKPAVAFTAEVANLYRAPTTLDNEREVMVHYTRGGFLGMGGTPRVATFNVLYSGGRVYVDSKEDFPAIEVLSNKPGERPLVVTRGRGELLALDGPIAEIRVRLRGQDLGSATSILLVDARNQTDVTNALFPTSQPNFTAAATDYMRGITEADETASGAAAVVAPAARRPVARIADPSVFDPLNEFFPPVNVRSLRDRPPYELPTQDLLRDFERKILASKKGVVVFVVPAGVDKREVLNRVLFEVTQAGTVPGLPRNQPFAELRPGVVGSKYQFETQNRLEVLNKVSEQLPESERVYLVNYDLATLTGFGKNTEDRTNMLASLLPAMETGRVTLITATTDSGLEEFWARNPQFRSVIGRVDVPNVKEEYVFTVMDAYSDRERKPRVPDAIKREFIELSERFSARGGQPQKVLDFLSGYYSLADERSLSEINRENMQKAAAKYYGLTAEDFDPELKRQRILRVIEDLNTKIIGMDHIKGAFVKYLEHERRGFFRGQPPPSFLLTGPRGLAKTLILSLMAKGIVGDRFKVIDMAGEEGKSIRLLYSTIAKAVSKNADTVIFFDEIEKASLEVQQALLKPMSERILVYQPDERSPDLETVSLRSVRFFAASNAGSKYLQEVSQRVDEVELQKAIAEGREAEYRATIFDKATYRKHLEREIIEPLLSRFEHRIFPVFPLSRGEFEAFVALKVREFERENSKIDVIGPVRVVNGEQFAREFTQKHWSPTEDLRDIAGLIGEAFRDAMGIAQVREGRAADVPVPADCQALLIKLPVE